MKRIVNLIVLGVFALVLVAPFAGCAKKEAAPTTTGGAAAGTTGAAGEEKKE